MLFAWKVEPPISKKEENNIMPLELSCTNEEKILITVNPVTAAGKSIPLDGAIMVSITSGDGEVESVDDNSFFVVSGDELAPSTFLVEGDADLGEGVVTISDVIVLNVFGAMAKNLGLVAGAPIVK